MYEILDYPNPPLVGSLSWGGPETIPFYDDPNFQAALDVGMVLLCFLFFFLLLFFPASVIP